MRCRETYSLPFLLFFDYFNTKNAEKKEETDIITNAGKKELKCAAEYDQTKLFSVHMLARLQMEEQWNMSADKKCINTKRDRKHINPQVSKLENMTQNKQNHTPVKA